MASGKEQRKSHVLVFMCPDWITGFRRTIYTGNQEEPRMAMVIEIELKNYTFDETI